MKDKRLQQGQGGCLAGEGSWGGGFEHGRAKSLWNAGLRCSSSCTPCLKVSLLFRLSLVLFALIRFFLLEMQSVCIKYSSPMFWEISFVFPFLVQKQTKIPKWKDWYFINIWNQEASSNLAGEGLPRANTSFIKVHSKVVSSFLSLRLFKMSKCFAWIRNSSIGK